jgi:hypothetical protein
VGLGVVLLGSPAYFIWRRRVAAPLTDALATSGAGKPGE